MQENHIRRQRIQDEILVDTYDEYEQQVAWYTYLSDRMAFPFRAQVGRRHRNRCELLQEVEVLALEEIDEMSGDQWVEVVAPEEEFTFRVRLEELTGVQADDETYEVIEDWKYWKKRA